MIELIVSGDCREQRKFKKFSFIALLFLFISCTAQNSFNSDRYKSECNEVSRGIFSASKFSDLDPQQNAFFLSCALSIEVTEINESRQSIKERKHNKQKAADFFLGKKLDINYRGEAESDLLMLTVVSNFEGQWKIATSKTLISKGIDLSNKNEYGKSALDLAEAFDQKNIIELIIAVKKEE